MPPQQSDRLPDLLDDGLGFRPHNDNTPTTGIQTGEFLVRFAGSGKGRTAAGGRIDAEQR